jgi:hypothetical protein
VYTAGLRAPAARRRIEELQADVSDHIEHERLRGMADSRIARGIASRMIRGVAADVAWRGQQNRAGHTSFAKERLMETTAFRSALRVTAFVLGVLAIPLAGVVLSDEVEWSVADFVLAGILLGLIGSCIEVAVRRRGSLLMGGAVVVLGVVATVVGEFDDAPGLMLLGVVMVASGGALAFRRVQRSPLT